MTSSLKEKCARIAQAMELENRGKFSPKAIYEAYTGTNPDYRGLSEAYSWARWILKKHNIDIGPETLDDKTFKDWTKTETTRILGSVKTTGSLSLGEAKFLLDTNEGK